MITEHVAGLLKDFVSSPRTENNNKQLTRNSHLNMNFLLGAGLLLQGKADTAQACKPMTFLSR